MELAPLSQYRAPDYPTKESLAQHPELLRALPRRWRESGGIFAKMAGLVAVTTLAALVILPMGTYGCVAVSPPLFLTEDEARAVIEDEAKKAGVEFAEHGHLLRGVDLPVTDSLAFLPSVIHKSAKPPGVTRKPHKRDETELDGWNPKLRIGYKFVARSEFLAWREKYRACPGNVAVYEAPAGIERIDGLEHPKGKEVLAVFYDRLGGRPRNPNRPGARPATTEAKRDNAANPSPNQAATDASPAPSTDYWERRNGEAVKRGNEELRQQVKDFIEWLKDEGILQ